MLHCGRYWGVAIAVRNNTTAGSPLIVTVDCSASKNAVGARSGQGDVRGAVPHLQSLHCDCCAPILVLLKPQTERSPFAPLSVALTSITHVYTLEHSRATHTHTNTHMPMRARTSPRTTNPNHTPFAGVSLRQPGPCPHRGS